MWYKQVLQFQELFEKAVTEYLKTIALDDQHQMAHYNLGCIYVNELQRPREGIKMFEKCLDLDPTDMNAQIYMTLAFSDLGMVPVESDDEEEEDEEDKDDVNVILNSRDLEFCRHDCLAFDKKERAQQYYDHFNDTY